MAEQQSILAHRAMLAGLRHELRTPLNAIIGYSEMLLEDDQGQDVFAPDLAKVHAAGKELLRSVNELLDPVYVEAGRLDLAPDVLDAILRDSLFTPINAIIETSEVLLRDLQFLERADECPPTSHDLAADLQRIRGAAERFLALITGVGGSAGGQAGQVSFNPRDVAVMVQGVASPITRLTQEAVVPDPAPKSAGSSTNRSGLPDRGTARTPGRGNLLVVDDSEANRDLLARHLRKQGHSVALAENGRQALERVHQEEFDLVLLDIMMPEVNGYEVLQHLKADVASRDIPVIMISALDEIDSVARCIEAGAEDYLPKPFNPVLLRARINACLEKKQFRDLEVDYLRNVALVTDAAKAVEAGTFDPNDLSAVAGRADALGHLARVFQQMVREMLAREQRVKEEEALKRELRLASEIQVSMLPARLPRPVGFDIGARMIPAQAVGGDFYDVFTPGAGRLGFAIGDVSGKGMPAALFTALTSALLRAEAMRTASPESVLRRVNRYLRERNGRGLFVTLLYGVLDEATHQFCYVRAGHEYPLLYDRTGAPLTIPEGRSCPLGVFQDPPLEIQTVTLLPGDYILLFTDGVTEAMDEQNELFGLERLTQCLAAHPEKPAQAMCDQIVEAVTAYQGQAPQSDDITLLVVRALG